jgi:hypothetical protein
MIISEKIYNYCIDNNLSWIKYYTNNNESNWFFLNVKNKNKKIRRFHLKLKNNEIKNFEDKQIQKIYLKYKRKDKIKKLL